VKNLIRFSVAWGSKFFRTLNREAALDSLRNVLSVVGLGTVLGDFATMRYWMVIPCAVVAFLVWMVDYHRHDFSQDELNRAESCARELKEAL
jgi:hypothetical protein